MNTAANAHRLIGLVGCAATKLPHAAPARELYTSANRSKGDGDLATWLPPARSYWCTYTAEIVAVKASYGLWMTPAEHSKASEILKECTK